MWLLKRLQEVAWTPSDVNLFSMLSIDFAMLRAGRRFCCNQTDFHTQIYLQQHSATRSLPFDECALLLFYILYMNI